MIALSKYVSNMQRFYHCAAYWAFQLEELGKLEVADILSKRKRRIAGRKKQRQDHFEVAEKLRQHVAAKELAKPSSRVGKASARLVVERREATKRQALSRSRRHGHSQSQQEEGAEEGDQDVFQLMPRLHWPAEEGAQAPANPASNMLWNVHPLPTGLRTRPVPVAVSSSSSDSDSTSDSSDVDHDAVAREPQSPC